MRSHHHYRIAVRLLAEAPQLSDSFKKLYTVVRTLLLGGVIAFLVWRIFVGWSQVSSIELHWNSLWIFGAFFSGVVAYSFLVVGFIVLLIRVYNFEARYLGLYTRIWWISYLYRYVPGKVFVLIERARMGVAVGIPRSVGAALVVVETTLAALAGMCMSILTVSYYASTYEQILIPLSLSFIGILIILPVGVRFLFNTPFVQRKFPELNLLSISISDIIVTIIPYIFHYFFMGLSFFLITYTVFPLSWTVFPGLCGVYALSHVSGLMLLLSPGGLGVREGVLSVQLGRLIPIGVTEVVAVGARIWFTLIELTIFLAVIGLCPRIPNIDRNNC